MNDLSALVGAEVRRLLLDHQVTLFLVHGPNSGQPMSAQLIMEAPFRFEWAGHVDTVDPTSKDTLSVVCRLLHAAVTVARVDHDVLALSFDDGSTITIGPSPECTSWQLIGQGVPHLVVTPWSRPI